MIGARPNQGYSYVASPPSDNSTYYWVITEQLWDNEGDFYKAQCGSNGFISGSALRANAVHHESDPGSRSHYHQYVEAQNDPDNNIGRASEAIVAAPGQDMDALFVAVWNEKKAAIFAAMAEETQACDGYVNRDHSSNCQTLGSINFSPYEECP